MNIGHFEELILAAIRECGADAYGTPLHKQVQAWRGRIPVSIGALYTALSRLEKRGFVKSWMGESTPERGGKAKRYFELTGSGARALQDAAARAQWMAGYAGAGGGQ